jgi:iron complex transport system ATP-binding protein
MDLMLCCHKLGFSYGEVPVLQDISFTLGKGRFCVVLGRNGSGKTTLIHCLNRVLRPSTGQITIDGQVMTSLSRNEIARAVSLVPQEHMEIFPFRVIDVVVMARAPFLGTATAPKAIDYSIAQDALKQLHAFHLADKNFNRISGGERQIVLLARAIAQNAQIMLLDEPTNHLDFNNQYHLLAAIKDLCRSNQLCILASMHDPNLAALFADEVIMLKNGRILFQGPSPTIMTSGHISHLYDIPTAAIGISDQTRLFLPEQVITSHLQEK